MCYSGVDRFVTGCPSETDENCIVAEARKNEAAEKDEE